MTTQENKEVHPSIQQEIEQTNHERSKWTTKQWYEHVGAWETPEGYISFGSVMAVSAMLIQFQRALWVPASSIGSIEDFNEFNRLIDELEGAASEAYSCGNDFGTGDKHQMAYEKLIVYIDGFIAHAVSQRVRAALKEASEND